MKKHNFQKSLNENYQNWYNRQCEAQISFKVGSEPFSAMACLPNKFTVSWILATLAT